MGTLFLRGMLDMASAGLGERVETVSLLWTLH